MSNENRDIDKHIKDAVEQHQINPPDKLWTTLEADLNIEHANRLDKKNKRRWFLLPLIFLLIVLTGILFLRKEYDEKQKEANQLNSALLNESEADIRAKVIDNKEQNNTIQKNASNPTTRNQEEIIAGSESNTKAKLKDIGASRENLKKQPEKLNKTHVIVSDKSEIKGKLKVVKEKSSKEITIPVKTKKKSKTNPTKAQKRVVLINPPIVNIDNKSQQDPPINSGSTLNKEMDNSPKQNDRINTKQKELLSDSVLVENGNLNKNIENFELTQNNELKPNSQGQVNIDQDTTNLKFPPVDIHSLTNNSFVQANDSVRKNSRFSIDIFGAPLFTRNYMVDNNPDNIDDPKAYATRERSKFSFSTGVALRYNLNDRFSLSIGAYYSTISYSVALSTIYAKIGTGNKPHYQYLTSWGTIEIPDYPGQVINEGDSLKFNTTCEQDINFINIPLIGRYKLSGSRLSFYLDAGFSVNFITREKAVVKVVDEEYVYEDDRIGIKNMNYYAILGVGASYRLSNKFSVFVEPIYRRSLSSITENIPVKTYPNSFGLNIGLTIHL